MEKNSLFSSIIYINYMYFYIHIYFKIYHFVIYVHDHIEHSQHIYNKLYIIGGIYETKI